MNEEIVSRIAKWARGEKVGPFRLDIWPTNYCNLSCSFCKTARFKKIKWTFWKELSMTELFRIIKEAKEMGVRECMISGGGEPLVRKGVVFQLMKKIKEAGMLGFLITNGTLLNKADINRIIEIGWDKIFFSIDGPSAKIHDGLRGVKGAFDKTTESMKYLYECKKEKGRDLPWMTINMVLNVRNYLYLEEMIKLANDLGCFELLLQSLMPDTPESNKMKINKKDMTKLNKILNKAKKLADEMDIKTNMEEFNKDKYFKKANKIYQLFLEDIKKENSFFSIPCYEPWYRVAIFPNGKIGPCTGMIENNANDIFIRSGKLKEAWFGPQFAEMRKQIFNKNLSEICTRCCIGKVFENREIRVELKNLLKNG